MIEFTTYDIDTGELLQTMRASDIHGVDAQCDENTSYVFGHWDRTTHYVRDGEALPRLDKPTPPR